MSTSSIARRIAGAVLGLALLVVAGHAQPVQAGTGSFTVKANDRKADGKSWRGSGAVFVGVPGVTPQVEGKNAPSMVLCTYSAADELDCPGAKGKDAKGRWMSPCHLSLDCEFEGIPIPKGDLVGVIVISYGIAFVSVVDAVVISHKKITNKDPAYQQFDEQLHQAVEKLAPSISKDEKRRRERRFPLLQAADCLGASCTLRQSQMKFELQ